MDSPNVEHLLQNYKVSDVIQIQKRLKNDVDKKKADLKTLIGERYNELLDATDSIEHMKVSVGSLITSLQDLNSALERTHTEVGHREPSVLALNPNDYTKASLSKILFDIPMQVWNSLEKGNIIVATYNYFYGISIYKALRSGNPRMLQHRLHQYNQMAIEDLNGYIIEHCWKCVARESAGSEVDHSKFADIFSCILLLSRNRNVNSLIVEFYTRQTDNISASLKSDSSLSVLLETLLNFIMNTIKCSRVFYQDSNYEALLVQRYRRIINSTFATAHLHHKQQENVQQYKIASDVDGKMLVQLDCSLTNDKIQAWVQSTQSDLAAILQSKVMHITSVKEIHREISSTEEKLKSSSRFSEWEDVIDIVDVQKCIWQECIKAVFERRVYEIAQQSLDAIIQKVDELLSSSQPSMAQCEVNLVEFVWKDCTATTSQSNHFQVVVESSCNVVSRGFNAFFEDICPLKTHYQHYLSNICKQVFDFLVALRERMNRRQDTTQFILFGAVFFDKLLQSCPSLRKLFELQPSCSMPTETCWASLESQIKAISDEYYCRWFELVVCKHFAHFQPDLFCDLNQFVQNLTCWEKVSIAEEKRPSTEQSASSTSVIEVPMQISLSLYAIIEGICADINRHCGYALPRTVLIYILSQMGQKALPVYEVVIAAMQSSEYPHTAKQTIAIQLYFDLSFLKNLFITAKDETLRANQLAQTNQQLTALESLIDPFDLHIMFPFIKANADKLFRSCSIVFGFLFADKSVFKVENASGLTKAKSTTVEDPAKEAVRHNIMLAHSSECTFAAHS